PLASVPVYAASNIISNSTFDSGVTGWSTYKESGGSCTLGTEDGKLALKVSSTGKVNYAVQVCYDIIPLYQNGVYRLKYDISSSVDRYVEGMIQQNGGTYQAYTWKGLSLTSEPQTVDYEFTMEEETDIMAKMVFNCGVPAEGETELPEHTIYLDNVSLELIDDSNVDYSATRPYEPDIMTNQVGYKPDSKKTAVFRNVEGKTEFEVINADTEEVVYTGTLSEPMNNTSADETDWTGDFSSVKETGNYFIKCGNLDNSYTFSISDNVYNNLLDDSVRMLYLQRCGVEVEDDTFGHKACHDTMATVYGTDKKIDVSGGWHDAGDYGRYVVPAAKAVADLLYAYGENPSLYSDNIGIPESNNGVPDILDEARFELEWMMKMQNENGGVHHKVSCESFPGYVMPEKETEPLIVTDISTTATADFCASMALAYEYYKDVDSEFAGKCLDCAKKAWAFLKEHPEFIFENPEDIVTGDYGDKYDVDERYWAAAQMYRATGDASYMDGVSDYTGLDWSTVGDYGNISILTMNGIDKESEIYKTAQNNIISQANKFISTAGKTAYGVSQSKFNWGSNMTIANSGIVLGLAYQLTGDTKYLDGANSQLDYLLGVNPVGECFVTGYGTVSPKNPHHRPSMAKDTAMKGMLVGGVNSGLEDSAAKAYCNGLPEAKCYVDNSESYSTNEITIYWNSPLTYLISLTENEKSSGNDDILWGDANCDGKVSIADAVLIMQALSNPNDFQLTEKGARNGDVSNNGDGITTADALAIQKVDIGLLKQSDLPESYMNEPPVVTTQSTTTTTKTTTTTTTTTVPDTPSAIKDYGTPMNEKATAVADFRKGETPLFFASDGWTNGSCFDCGWYKKNTSFDGGVLNLTIDKDKSGKYNYSGAEYRTADFYHYGYYETSMQAIKNDGVVSSFFTYTGPSDNNPWDEIDIEILGKDTTKVQLNYYTNGVGNHEYMYDLGFDASEGFHTYGFDWQSDHITWYVDGKEVYTATENIPSTPGKIMMNVWPGITVDDWLKPFDGKTPLTARYQWVTYDK
ncbi:MAG: glycoside hydrolase family 9 protein, partial [Prevotella sp.]|nr:glycoside hydrolase family 9 protein [Prevotella sp.]